MTGRSRITQAAMPSRGTGPTELFGFQRNRQTDRERDREIQGETEKKRKTERETEGERAGNPREPRTEGSSPFYAEKLPLPALQPTYSMASWGGFPITELPQRP